ncbi:ArsR/SmtB family transcription factor [Halosimplex marinum]|uniref:ArsR/SmtB family transcription factor n=1 Tax=Halosimplex marinum TaxID=3396620 RepID=UPI003F546188
MSHLLPREPPVDGSAGPEVVAIGDEESGAVFSALSADRARSILSELYREPATQSELADRVDTSLQNVDYHLGNLVDAGLVAVVGQWYSEKGTEMDVYAPDGDPLVLIAGDGDRVDDTRRAVSEGGPAGTARGRTG